MYRYFKSKDEWMVACFTNVGTILPAMVFKKKERALHPSRRQDKPFCRRLCLRFFPSQTVRPICPAAARKFWVRRLCSSPKGAAPIQRGGQVREKLREGLD